MANIMIIDDKPYMSFLVSEDLSLEGHTIKCFEDVRAAMEEFDSNMPDIVLFDIYFKGSEGWDTLHSMKISYPDIPVIIVSLYRNFISDPRIREADGYVLKNIRTGPLVSKIREMLSCRPVKEKKQ